MITESTLTKAFDYTSYLEEIKRLLAEGKSTGDTQTDEYLEYSKLNLHRMQRLDKTVVLTDDFRQVLDNLKKKYVLLIISEGWCGDTAQLVPVFAAIEKYSTKVEVRILLRDENPEVMDQYLTNGSRSIPKVICLERQSLKEEFVWGPRPAELQNLVMPLIKNKAPKAEKSLLVQKWYNDDKTLTTQKELMALFERITK